MQLGNFSKDFLKTESMALELIYFFSQNCFLHLSKGSLLRVLYITNITEVKKKKSIQVSVKHEIWYFPTESASKNIKYLCLLQILFRA